MTVEHQRGLADTNVVIHLSRLSADALPPELAISAITLAELSAGPHAVRGDDETARAERGRRLDTLQRAENEFDTLPFDADAARAYGRVRAAAISYGRRGRSRNADLQIAAVAAANKLPLYTTNLDDFAGLDGLVEVVAVPRPDA